MKYRHDMSNVLPLRTGTIYSWDIWLAKQPNAGRKWQTIQNHGYVIPPLRLVEQLISELAQE